MPPARGNLHGKAPTLSDSLSHPWVVRTMVAQWSLFIVLGLPMVLVYARAPDLIEEALFTAGSLAAGFSLAMLVSAPAPPRGEPRMEAVVARNLRRSPLLWGLAGVLVAAGAGFEAAGSPVGRFLAAPGLALLGIGVGLFAYYPAPPPGS
ncbi:MAG TPA: hypothetical protein VNZ52_13785 [Candidatus Thermoplasmatota archaeon]|nr:hypothetical protein [Candidatus Thermoplasmatota archaeon]